MTVIQEPIIRLAAFIAVLAAMVLWETVAPRRSRSHARIQRWPSNFAIVALNTGLLRILLTSGRRVWRSWLNNVAGVCSTICRSVPGEHC